MNEIFLLTEVIATFVCMLLSFKLFNKKGLILWMVISLCLSFLMNLKIINFICFDVNLGMILYVSNFICLNILLQKYGKRDLSKYIIICVLSLLVVICFVSLSTAIDSSSFNLLVNSSYDKAFYLDAQFVFAFILTYIISSWININIYYYLRTTRNNILISNCYSSAMVYFIDSILFVGFAFFGKSELTNLIVLIVVTTVIKYVVSWIGTSVLYITNRIGL